tara:strand:+ start:7410 stop:8573 length:1164 start_codon:yes stop_codon:yes gene_type:complete
MVIKACVVTATRAEYGLLKPLIEAFNQSDDFQLQLLVTGTHLSSEFGMTWKSIEEDGYKIDAKVEMLLSSDTSVGVSKSLGMMCIGLADTFELLQPDFIVILGDRYEMVGVATVANLFGIPIVHIHGGEITQGALDDNFRHAITKLSHLHFSSTSEYRKRIIQLGESPKRVFEVGAIGIDNIRNMPLLSRNELSESIDLDLSQPYFLVTYHPVTVGISDVNIEIDNLISALLAIPNTQSIITLSNADVGGRQINERLKFWRDQHPKRISLFTSLGQLRYLSAMKYCIAVVGNSSSGIVEAPSMMRPTVNIGDRQKGRTQAASMLNCAVDIKSITHALTTAVSEDFQMKAEKVINPYGEGEATPKIMSQLRQVDWSDTTNKKFYDLTK